jgi:hypothetical protein
VKLLVVAAAGDLRDSREVGLDRLGRLGEDVGDAGLELLGELAGAFGVPLGERSDDLSLKDRPGPVVREPGGSRLPGGLRHDLVVEPERLPGELDLGGAGGLPVPDSRREHAGHHGPALDLLGEPSLSTVRRDPGEQLPHRTQQHVRLPEAGQHLADIA